MTASTIDLAEGRRLLAEATPRPWGRGHGETLMTGATDQRHRTVFVTDPYRGPDLSRSVLAPAADANAALIVWAVNNLPVLIEAAEERHMLQSRLDQIAREESGWLIECPTVNGPLWLSIGGPDEWLFTKDHIAAVRFARKKDAEALLRLVPDAPGNLFASEHMWG